MTFFQIDSKNALYFAYQEPKTDKPTFVFVNPLTGSTDTWVGPITENICAQGFGYLTFDFRGQGKSSFDSQIELSTDLIVSDLICMIQHVKPKKTTQYPVRCSWDGYGHIRNIEKAHSVNNTREFNTRVWALLSLS